MANKHTVTDDGDLRKYYAAIPKIVLQLGLNPFELALYVHFKEAAGDKGGVCWKSRATIAKESRMSVGMVTKARAALELPRPEFNGRSLITVTEEPSKTGGKPTCRVTITDVWAANMTRFSTSPHDGATSYSDGDPKPTSYSDSQRHTVTLSTSPHAPKEEPLKKNNKEEEQSPHSRLMALHASFLVGEIPNGGAQGAAIKWLLERYDVADLERCYLSMREDRWRNKVTWQSVKSEIGEWLARHPGDPAKSTNGNGSTPRPLPPAPVVREEELRMLGIR